MEEQLSAFLSSVGGALNATGAFLAPVNALLAGGIASIIVGILASSIGAYFQFRQTTRREGTIRFHELMSEYEQYQFSLPKAVENDLNAMREGWDNMFYMGLRDPFSSTLYLAVLIGRFNKEYLKYISADKRRFFEVLGVRQDEVMQAVINLAKSLPNASNEDFQRQCHETVDHVVSSISFSEAEFPKGYIVLNEASLSMIRSRIMLSVEAFVHSQSQASLNRISQAAAASPPVNALPTPN